MWFQWGSTLCLRAALSNHASLKSLVDHLCLLGRGSESGISKRCHLLVDRKLVQSWCQSASSTQGSLLYSRIIFSIDMLSYMSTKPNSMTCSVFPPLFWIIGSWSHIPLICRQRVPWSQNNKKSAFSCSPPISVIYSGKGFNSSLKVAARDICAWTKRQISMMRQAMKSECLYYFMFSIYYNQKIF